MMLIIFTNHKVGDGKENAAAIPGQETIAEEPEAEAAATAVSQLLNFVETTSYIDLHLGIKHGSVYCSLSS